MEKLIYQIDNSQFIERTAKPVEPVNGKMNGSPEIIFLYFFQHLTHKEIGKRYGRTRSTAGRHIYLDLQRLREEMEVLSRE